MATSGHGVSGTPALLLQYSYYLSRDATKCVSVGIDPVTFGAKMIIFSPTAKKSVCLSPIDWTYLHTSHESVRNYLTYKTERAHFTSDGLAVKSIVSKTNLRLIRLTNNPHPSKKINLNFNEWQNLKVLTPYLNTLMMKFMEISPFVQRYFQTYINRCQALNKDPLNIEDYFPPEEEGAVNHPTFNSYRLFNEIPYICEERILKDLYPNQAYLNSVLLEQ